MSRTRHPALAIFLSPLLLLSACTGLEPAVVGAGASAAESGVSFFERGKVTSFEPVYFDDALEAVRYTATTLHLTIVDDEADDDEPGRRHRLVLRDERGESLVFIVERRTESITRMHADVGTFGPTPLVGLVMNRTIERLKTTGAHDRVWPRPTPVSGSPDDAQP